MSGRTRRLVAGTLFAAASIPASAFAELGNMSYQQAELFEPIAFFDSTNMPEGPPGSNTVAMLRDYMLVMGSYDSGKANGAFHLFDMADPHNPSRMTTIFDDDSKNLRELHAVPIAMVGGKDYMAFPSVSGIQIWDFTDPMTGHMVGSLDLDGVNAGDYDNAAWQLSWGYPYLFVGGTGNGVYIVDTSDPATPTLVNRITTGEMGGFRIGPTHIAGNYLVVASMDNTPHHVSVVDVSDPTTPLLMATGQAPNAQYSVLVIGDRIYGAGANGNYSIMSWNDTQVQVVKTMTFGSDKGGYCTFQDHYIFCGQSADGFRKVDVADEANPVEIGNGTLDIEGADMDFATVLGNLVYLGNDHGNGGGLLPHAMAPDTTAPAVVKIYPEANAINQPLTSRVTVFMSDGIDMDSITPENYTIRPNGGAALEGGYAISSFNALSFMPTEPFEADTTYEIVIGAGGLTDLSGNAIEEEVIGRFSTGATVEDPIPQAMGGAGGMSAGGAGGDGQVAQGGAGGTGVMDPTTMEPDPMMGDPMFFEESDEGGCGCSVPGQDSRHRGTVGLLSLAALAAMVRLGKSRRRNQRQS